MTDAEYQRIYDEVHKELVTPGLREKLRLLTEHAQDPEIDSLRQRVRELTEENESLTETAKRRLQDMGLLASDLSAALVSVDAMAERLRTLQPIVSVLGDWDWAAIGADVDEVGTAHLIDDRALMAVIKALAHTAREQAKGEE